MSEIKVGDLVRCVRDDAGENMMSLPPAQPDASNASTSTSNSPTVNELLKTVRKFSGLIDRSQVAIRIRCHPLVFKAVRNAYWADDALRGLPDHFDSLKIIADVDMWPRCYEIEYADGSKELFTPFGSIRKPPTLQPRENA